jgi:hypothetical protein
LHAKSLSNILENAEFGEKERVLKEKREFGGGFGENPKRMRKKIRIFK